MGSRAAYVIRRDGVAAAYGSHWGASSIMDWIFWGPEYATRAFIAMEPLESLEDIDGGDEGTVLIDWDARRLLWWASNCNLPAHQRLFNRLAAANWPGWQIDSAVGHQNDILQYLGIVLNDEEDLPADEEIEEEEDVSAEEDEEEEQDEEEDENGEEDEGDEGEVDDDELLDPESVCQPDLPEPPLASLDELTTGCWVTVRSDDGSLRDYFVADHAADDLLEIGGRLPDLLPREKALAGPVPELLAVEGIFIDQKEQILWRWKGPRYGWRERQLERIWPEFRFRDLDGGWAAHREATGRSAAGLEADERALVGCVAAGLLTDSSVDPRRHFATMAALAKRLRVGCLTTALLVGLLGAGLAIWLDSPIAAVVAVLVFGACLVVALWLWRRTAITIQLLGSSSDNETSVEGMSPEEKRPILSRALVAAGFPSLEALKAAGELPV